jgi:anti-anti-sigma factor
VAELNEAGIVAVVEESSAGTDEPVIVLSGELDLSNVDVVRPVIEQILERRPKRIVFDLAELQFMDSSGLAVLIHAANTAPGVELRGPSTIVRRIIDVTGLSDLFSIAP